MAKFGAEELAAQAKRLKAEREAAQRERANSVQKEKELAMEAKRITDSPLFKEAFDELHKKYIDYWKRTPLEAKETRENLYHAILNLESVKLHFVRIIEGGKVADLDLENWEKQKKQTG